MNKRALTLLNLYNKITGQAWSMFDTDAESSDDFEPAVINSIQKALSYLWCSYKFPFRIKTFVFNSSKNKDSYPLPNGNIIKKVISDNEVYAVKYNKKFLEYLSNYETLEEKTGEPKGFYIKNDKIFLYPTPDNAYKISIEYLNIFAVLSSDGTSKANLEEETDYIDIPEKYEDLFANALLPLAQLYNIASEQDENYSAYKNQFDSAYKILIDFTQGIDLNKSIGW